MNDTSKKRENAMIAKYGSVEKWKEKQKEWGSVGGKKSGGGFKGMTKAERSENGKRGYKAMIAKAMRGENDDSV